jgi:protein PsiE
MTSLARDLILRGATDGPERMLMTTFGIVLLAVGVLILSFGQHRFPAEVDDVEEDAHTRR